MLAGNTYGSVSYGGVNSKTGKPVTFAHDNFKIVGEISGNSFLGEMANQNQLGSQDGNVKTLGEMYKKEKFGSGELTQQNLGEI